MQVVRVQRATEVDLAVQELQAAEVSLGLVGCREFPDLVTYSLLSYLCCLFDVLLNINYCTHIDRFIT